MIKLDPDKIIPLAITIVIAIGTVILMYNAYKELTKKKGERDSVGATRLNREQTGKGHKK